MLHAVAIAQHRDRVLIWATAAGVPEPDVEDVAQSVFAALASAQPPVPAAATARWLRTATAYVARRHLARLARRREDAPAEEPPCRAASPADAVAGRQVERVLGELVQRIEPARRDVLLRHVLDEEPIESIALAQGVGVETARKRLRLARRDLRRLIERLRARERRTAGGVSFVLVPWPRRWLAIAVAVVVPALLLPAVLLSGGGVEHGDAADPPPSPSSQPWYRPAATWTTHRDVKPANVVAAAATSTVLSAHSAGVSTGGGPACMVSVQPPELPEHALVALARRALADGALARARTYLARAARAYPHGSLAPERAALARQLP